MNQENLSGLIGKWKSKVHKKDFTPIQMRGYNLYHTPLDDFQIDDIRFMIGQKMGLQYLLPIAFSLFEKDILVEGSYYKGDVLSMVFTIKREFWNNNPDLKSHFLRILLDNKETLDNVDQIRGADEGLIEEMKAFLEMIK